MLQKHNPHIIDHRITNCVTQNTVAGYTFFGNGIEKHISQNKIHQSYITGNDATT